MEEAPTTGRRIYLIQSDDAEPRVKLVPGKRYEVTITAIVDTDLEAVAEETETSAARRPARLCRSRKTCLAVFETE